MANFSIVDLSDLEGGKRLDPDYYRKELKELARNLAVTAIPLRVIAKRLTQGPNPHFTEAGIPCLNGRSIVAGRIDLDNTNFVSREEFEQLSRFRLLKGDILVTLKGLGSIGQTALVTQDLEAIFSRDIGLIRIDPAAGVLPEYVYACLASPTGRLLLDRGATGGTGQMTLTTTYLGSIPIQLASPRRQATVARLVQGCDSEQVRERELYNAAEQMLLRNLRWDDINLAQPSSWEVSLELAKTVHRIDAEHFQPKYQKLLTYLAQTGRTKPLGNISTHVGRGRQPRYVQGGPILVINSRHVGKRHIKFEQAESTDELFWQKNPKARVQKYDVTMNSTGWGTIGRANCILHDQPSVVDNHVTVIRVNQTLCNPLYLAAYLNSLAGLMQTEQWLSGSSGQVEIYPGEIGRFLIYLPQKRVQDGIADLIRQSYLANRKAWSFLEEALTTADAAIREGMERRREPANEEEREQRETWEHLKKALDHNRAGSRQLFK